MEQKKRLWHAKSKKQILEILKTSEKGLGEDEAKRRLEKYGENKLRKVKKLQALKILINQFRSFLIYIILFAALVSLIFGRMLDFYVILAIIIINVILGFFQEYKAEKSLEELKRYMVNNVTVMRKGEQQQINSEQIVPGDILILQEGDRIMADSRLIDSTGIQVNEMPLTGESVASSKHTKALPIKTVLADRENMLYFGTEVVQGRGEAVVVNTGMDTEFGKISRLVQEVKAEKTPLQVKIDEFARNLGIIVLIIAFIIFLIGISTEQESYTMFLTAISLAVSAIPEGLPAVITLTLALTLRRMAKSNVLIRKLPAAETLGRVTILCTDKTGTLTSGEMNVEKIYSEETKKISELKKEEVKKNKNLIMLFKTAVLCNGARIEKDDEIRYLGDPTETALLSSAYDLGFDKISLTKKERRIGEFEFTSERKMMTVVRTDGTEINSYVKGSPEEILKRCNKIYKQGKITDLSNKERIKIKGVYEDMAAKGLRVLGFAFKPLRGYKEKIEQEQAEKNLVFVGLQGMIDPPRKEVAEAIKLAGKAGIRVIMITGDSDLTARAVGDMINLKGELIKADELEKMSDAELKQRIKDTAIFSRASPEQKLRIINILKEKEEVVGVTGDGVNDAPALKRADIGIAMGIKGTDVSKDVSDIILLDDNFASIIKAVEEGRRSYSNIKKFIRFLLRANFGEVAIIFFGLLLGVLPILPLQILWINLVTDSFPALALGVEKAEKDVMKKNPDKSGIFSGLLLDILISGLVSSILGLILFFMYVSNIDKARTLTLSMLVFFELFFVFPVRSKDKLLEIGFFSNKKLIYAVLLSALLHVLLVYSPINQAFGIVPLSLNEWFLVFAFSIPALILFEGLKYIKRDK